MVQDAADGNEAVKKLGGFEAGLYAEGFVNFTMELAVMVARSRSGEVGEAIVRSSRQRGGPVP